MKTVGIITTFRQPNWGSVLQAYALQLVVSKLGYEVSVIDYKYPNGFHYAHGRKRVLNESFRTRLGRIRRKLFMRLGLMKKDKMYILNEFISENINLTKAYDTYESIHQDPPFFDIYMSGSDQIWNPNTMLGDMTYLFDFAKTEYKRIAYASSFSCLSIPSHLVCDYIKYLSLFQHISVRESNGAKTIHKLIGRDVPVVLDPTLLLNKNSWHQIALKAHELKLPPKYILCYMLAYTYNPTESMSILLTEVQRKYPFPVIALMGNPKDFNGECFNIDKLGSIGIEEFLYIIENATLIVSSSFHGSAFALNFGKPLIALTAINEDDRLQSLLDSVNLSNHIRYVGNLDLQNLVAEYNVEEEQCALQCLRDESMKFLLDALNN